jgi:hypothetical protein
MTFITGFTMTGPDPDGARENAEFLQKARDLLAEMAAAKAEHAANRERQVREFNESIGRGR